MSAKQKPKTEPHIRHPVELLKSPAMWVLSRAAHKILMYAECQGAKFAGKKNGKVPITYESLEAQGLHTDLIPPAVNEIHALGVGEVRRGRGGNAEFRRPNFIRLTYLPSGENCEIPPTHEWKAINTLEEAKEIAKQARAKKSKTTPRKRGRLHPQKLGVKHPSFRPQKLGDTDPNFHPQKLGVLSSNAIRHSRPAAPEPEPVADTAPKPDTACSPRTEPVLTVVANREKQRQQHANKANQDLVEMITVLREVFGNRAVNAEWQREMQARTPKGWSRPRFMLKLAALKERQWVKVARADGVDGDKTLQGDFYAATELAPGAVGNPVLDQSRPGMNESRSELAKAKQAAKELLKKAKPSHAA